MDSQTSIIPFVFDDALMRAHLDEKGNPWFVAKDVCRVLEIQNPSDTVHKVLEEDEHSSVDTIYTSSNGVEQTRSVLVISESGLYSLVFRSRKPEAKRFRKWVTAEVLPTLRKTGTYTIPGAERPLPESMRHVKPVVRERLLATAQRVLNMSGVGGPEDVEKLFFRYCDLVTAGYSEADASRATSSSVIIDQEMVEKIMRFADTCCEPVTQNRLRASKLYAAFCRWWQKQYDEPAPTIAAFGRTFSRRYRKEKRGGQTYYLDVHLAQ